MSATAINGALLVTAQASPAPKVPTHDDIRALAELVSSFRLAYVPTSTRVLSDACLEEINRVVMVFTAQFQ